MAKANTNKGNNATVNKAKTTKEAKEMKVYVVEIKASEMEINKVGEMLTEMKLAHKVTDIQDTMGTTKATKANKPVAMETEGKTKGNDKFDRKKYLEIGEKLGVKYVSKKDGEEKIYGFARKIVYAAMEEKTLTAAKVKEYKKQIADIAKGNEKIQRYFKIA